jgi:hypothetical protein
MTENSTQATRFAAAYALLRMAADLGDHWINAAKAVSTMPSVSVPRLGAGFGDLRSLGAGVALAGSRHFASQFPLAGDRR